MLERTLALFGWSLRGNKGRVLVVNLLGIGNCILTTPTISALRSLGFKVDVLVHRNRASDAVFKKWKAVENIYYHDTPLDERPRYDHALWAHPRFGPPGRYHHPKCPVQFVNPSPGDPRPYFARFNRHEVVEVLELARHLGYTGIIPELHPPHASGSPALPARPVAIGIGYLKDGSWDRKHWGNDRFAACCRTLIEAGFSPILVGDTHDEQKDGWIIQRDSGARSVCGKLPLAECFKVLQQCVAYIGNDTGLMHAAAAYRLPTIGIFCMTNPVKNAPWGDTGVALPGSMDAQGVVAKLHEMLARRAA